MLHLLAGIAWDPQIRGFLAVLVGVVVLMGSVYLLLGTNLGSRLGLPRRHQRHLRLVHDHGPHLVDLRHHRHARRGAQAGRSRRSSTRAAPPTTPASRTPRSRRRATSTPPRCPRPEELNDLDADATSTSCARRSSRRSAAGGSCPSRTPAFGEAKATVDEHFVANPDEELGLEGAADYVTVYSFERGGKDGLPDDPSRLDRITTKLKTTFWQVQHPPHYAIIQMQPVKEQEAGARARRPRPRWPTRPSRW